MESGRWACALEVNGLLSCSVLDSQRKKKERQHTDGDRPGLARGGRVLEDWRGTRANNKYPRKFNGTRPKVTRVPLNYMEGTR